MSKIAQVAAAVAMLLLGAPQAMAVQWDNPDAAPQDEATTQSAGTPETNGSPDDAAFERETGPSK